MPVASVDVRFRG